MKKTHRISALILAMIITALLIVPAFAAVITKRHSGIYIGDVTFYIFDSAYSKPYYSYTRPGSVDVSIFGVNDEITYCLEPFQPSEVDARYQESGFPSYMAGRDTAVLRAICYGAPANGDDSDEARVATQLLIWDISMGYADGQWNWISPDKVKPPFYAAAESLLPNVKAKYDTVVAALKANSGLPYGITLSDLHVWDDDGTYDPRLQTMVSVNVPSHGKLSLKKTSSNTAVSEGNSNYSLAGAVYGVYASKGDATSDKNRIATLTTAANGVSNTVENLSPATYWVREVTAPKGFALDTTPVSVTVEANKTAQVTMSDNPQTDPVGILLRKVDSTTNGAPASSNVSLEGAEFTVKFYGGNYGTATAAESSGTLKRTWVIKTNNNGYCELAQRYKVSGDDFYLTPGGVPTLPLGTVVIQETKAPAGYKINSQKYVVQITSGGVSTDTVNTYNAPTVSEDVTTGKVTLKKTSEDGKVSEIEFTVTGPNNYSQTVKTNSNGEFTLTGLYPGTYTVTENTPSDYQLQEPQTVTIAPGETGTVTFANKLRRGKVMLTKTSEDGKVSGIEFTVTGPDNYSKTVKTNAEGTFTLTNLYPGTYTVTENTPSDYQTQDPQTVTIGPGETGTVTFANKLRRGKVMLTKTSEDGKVSGIEFTVTGPKNYKKTVKTDANGKFTLTDLYPGTYTVVETVPNRYDSQEPQTVTIAPGETGTVSFYNKLSRATIRIVKLDGETSEPLAGAGFRLFDATGTVIDEGVTNINGVLTFENLVLGEYSYQEYKVPKGFVLDETVYPVTLDTGGSTVTHTRENTPRTGSISVHKVNASGVVMPGTKLMLQSSKDEGATWKNVSSKTTDKNGDATWTDLPVRGIRYRIVEIKANAGSSLMTKPIWEGTLPLKIDKDKVPEGIYAEIIDNDAFIYDLRATAINTPTMVLPFTGSNTMAVYMSLAMLALCAGIYFMKKSKEEIYE